MEEAAAAAASLEEHQLKGVVGAVARRGIASDRAAAFVGARGGIACGVGGAIEPATAPATAAVQKTVGITKVSQEPNVVREPAVIKDTAVAKKQAARLVAQAAGAVPVAAPRAAKTTVDDGDWETF